MRTVTVAANEVQTTVLAAQKAGEIMLHNDRLRDGRHTLTFVTSAEDPRKPTPEPPNAARLRVLYAKLKDDTATLAEIKEMLRLERGL